MRIVFQLLLMTFACIVNAYYMEWWGISVWFFFIAFWGEKKPWLSFLSGFGVVFIVWFTVLLHLNITTDYIMALKLSSLTGFGVYKLQLMSTLMGAIVGGLGALNGTFVRQLFIKKKKVQYYPFSINRIG